MFVHIPGYYACCVFLFFGCGQIDKIYHLELALLSKCKIFFKLDLVFSILMWGERFQQSIYIGMDILGVLNPIGECKVLLKLAPLEHSGSGQKF